MRSARLWAGLLGLAKVVVEDVEFDEVEQVLVVSARPRKPTKRRCGRCGKRCPGYEQGLSRTGAQSQITVLPLDLDGERMRAQQLPGLTMRTYRLSRIRIQWLRVLSQDEEDASGYE